MALTINVLPHTFVLSDKLLGWLVCGVNATLTWVFVAATAVGYAFLSGVVVSNVSQDVTIITSATTLLLGGVLDPLSSWIQPRVLNVKKVG